MADIEQRRTVHGGTDSALSVQVIGWCFDGSGFNATGDIDQAHGVGVYIRNPLAFHLVDYCGPGGAEYVDIIGPRFATIREAALQAHSFAQALADHLGCKVDADLPNPGTAPAAPVSAAPAAIDAATLCETAACLWEAALDLKAAAESATKSPRDEAAARALAEFEAEGTSAMRFRVVGLAEECERAWRAADPDTRGDCFDWDFCPDWLAKRMGWAPAEPSLVERVAKLRADAAALDDGMSPEQVRELHAAADALERFPTVAEAVAYADDAAHAGAGYTLALDLLDGRTVEAVVIPPRDAERPRLALAVAPTFGLAWSDAELEAVRVLW